MMKRIWLCLLVFLLLPLITSASISLNQEYKKSETLIAKVSGLFTEPIQEKNVLFYRGTVKIPMDFDIGKIGDDFYIKAQLNGRATGNYSIKIQNVRYYNLSDFSVEPFSANFSIISDFADFSVESGFILTNSNFSIDVRNFKDTGITLNVKTPEGITTEGELDIPSPQLKIINFQIDGVKKDFIGEIEISSNSTKYIIPLSVYGIIPKVVISCEKDSECGNNEICKGKECVVKPECEEDDECDNGEICKNDKCILDIECENNDECDGKEVCKENKCVVKPECETDSECNVNRTGYVCDENKRCIDEIAKQTCQDRNGSICALEDQNCVGDSEVIREYPCCLGVCEDKPKSSSGKAWGWGLLILSFVFIVWFYIKYKRTKSKAPDMGGIARGRRF
jgi:hypothetical protein